MRLSSVYLYEKIKEKYEILKKGNLSGNDGYLRPFLRCGINRDDRKKEDRFRSGHVYVIQVRDDEEWERVVPVMKDIFWIFCKQCIFINVIFKNIIVSKFNFRFYYIH